MEQLERLVPVIRWAQARHDRDFLLNQIIEVDGTGRFRALRL